MQKLLYVCLGNICRSPVAHGVTEFLIKEHNLEQVISCDSCGTSLFHVGESPNLTMCQTALKYNYDINHLKSRSLVSTDFADFDMIFAMDSKNYTDLRNNCPIQYQDKISMFLSHNLDISMTNVPDPYYSDSAKFNEVFLLIEETCQHIIKKFL